MMTEAEILVSVERLTSDRLEICCAHAWVRPRASGSGRVFDDMDRARLELIVELTEDMGVNDDALPVILGLIDEVSSLRRHMRAVDAALSAESAEVYAAVIARLGPPKA